MRKLFAAAFLMFVAAAPAAAQDKPLDINLGFGWALPEGDIGKTFDAGWDAQLAATYNIRPKLGIQAEYMYMRMGGPDKTINVSVTPGGPGSNQLLESNHQVHALLGDVVYKSHNAGSMVGGYAIGGLGYYHRKIQITSPAVGYATYCDP